MIEEELVFDDLEPATIPVKIGGERYILREASSSAAVKFRDVGIKAARMEDGKVVGLTGAAEAEPLLVSLCLIPLGQNDKPLTDRAGNVVGTPLAKVQAWPHRIIKRLYDEVVRISPYLIEKETKQLLEKRLAETQKKLDALGAEDPAKNSPSAGTDTLPSPTS